MWPGHHVQTHLQINLKSMEESKAAIYIYPSLDKRRRLKVLPDRSGPLKVYGGTTQSPLVSGLRAPFLPSYNGIPRPRLS